MLYLYSTYLYLLIKAITSPKGIFEILGVGDFLENSGELTQLVSNRPQASMEIKMLSQKREDIKIILNVYINIDD